LLAGHAAADRVCYSGTETFEIDGQPTKHALVVVRELDREKSEIRQQSWTDADSEVERAEVFAVDAKAGTFEFSVGKNQGSGTLDGDAWKWTGYHVKVNRDDIKMSIDAKLGKRSLSVATQMQLGKGSSTRRWEATTFDCKDLDKRKRALDPMSSATATRTCYAGTATASDDGKSKPVVVVQIVDKKRIELRHRFGSLARDRVDVLTIDGDKVMLDGVTPATLTGKPGAWTGYAWSDKGSAVQMAVKGTLGGDRVKHEITMTSAAKSGTITFDATKFDCADLAAKRDALH
jgi:hypothetical protein